MGGIINDVKSEIERKYGSYTSSNSLDRDGCKVNPSNITFPYFVIDLDCPKFKLDKSTRCDFLIFIDDCENKVSWIIPLELKSGPLDTSVVEQQLKASSRFAYSLFFNAIKFSKNKQNSKQKKDDYCVIFYPVVFSKCFPTIQVKKLKNISIKFHNEPFFIKGFTCGSEINLNKQQKKLYFKMN